MQGSSANWSPEQLACRIKERACSALSAKSLNEARPALREAELLLARASTALPHQAEIDKAIADARVHVADLESTYKSYKDGAQIKTRRDREAKLQARAQQQRAKVYARRGWKIA